jgi:hypothetical protein
VVFNQTRNGWATGRLQIGGRAEALVSCVFAINAVLRTLAEQGHDAVITAISCLAGYPLTRAAARSTTSAAATSSPRKRSQRASGGSCASAPPPTRGRSPAPGCSETPARGQARPVSGPAAGMTGCQGKPDDMHNGAVEADSGCHSS